MDHVVEAMRLIEEAATGSPDLGRPPADLAEVLATRSVAGPATSALRALTRASGPGTAAAVAARDAAARIAWNFRTLFSLPEATYLIRGGRTGDDTPYWRQVVDYCAAGNLQAVLDDYLHTLRDLEGLFASNQEEAWSTLAAVVSASLSLRTGAPRSGPSSSHPPPSAREGLDFHAYCHSVMRWNLPSNPVDLEQREGRVHRYKGHAVRKNVAAKHGADVLDGPSKDVWSALFEIALEQSSNESGLVPYWLYPVPDGAQIERHVPALPLKPRRFTTPSTQAIPRCLQDGLRPAKTGRPRGIPTRAMPPQDPKEDHAPATHRPIPQPAEPR